MSTVSPFLHSGPRTKTESLAIVHLSRDNLVPSILNGTVGAVDGYAEGNVINTRFGSFPHSTLINQPWGSQVRASIVDTGSRGRKRKVREETDEPSNDTEEPTTTTASSARKPATAASGFVHVLPPTPELWTMGLPHRTQVVYTPDYSYILHRIRARPGMRIIEAGAGSGSFTHASVRAVYNGYPTTESNSQKGKVFSFEFNEARYHAMTKEIDAHGLKELVQMTHRDVYNDGFLVNGESPAAESVFLDLPAPWKALPHLSRSRPATVPADQDWVSPLRSDRPVHLCTFSPCIEQVTRTVDAMRRLGWMDIEMVEVAHRRINVVRERIGSSMPADKSSNQNPADVSEALDRLREVEGRFKEFHGRGQQKAAQNADGDADGDLDMGDASEAKDSKTNGSTEESSPKKETESSIPPFMLGNLVHRTEPEIKTHTSYLVFAVLPQEWTEEQEAEVYEKWPCGQEKKVIGSLDKATRKQEKRELLQGKGKKNKKQRK